MAHLWNATPFDAQVWGIDDDIKALIEADLACAVNRTVDVLWRSCPHCEAKPGEFCVMPSGKVYHWWHLKRQRIMTVYVVEFRREQSWFVSSRVFRTHKAALAYAKEFCADSGFSGTGYAINTAWLED